MLFDELLSWPVARALRELGFRTSHVGHEEDRAPPRGSGDDVILAHARRTNQVIVTSNLDLILLCAEENESVIWIDPRGRHLSRPAFVLLVSKHVDEWQVLLNEATEPMCVRALRTKSELISLDRARHLVVQRMRVLRRRKRARARQRQQGLNEQLFEDDA